MPFEYYTPCPNLAPCIHNYWILKGGNGIHDTLLPDGCIDIIGNPGKRFAAVQKGVVPEEGCVYPGGA